MKKIILIILMTIFLAFSVNAYEQHFDNSDWAGAYGGMAATWTGSAWQSVWNPTYGLWGVGINELGSWNSGYRPESIRVTFSGASGTVYLDLYDGSDMTGNKIIDTQVCTSGNEITADFSGTGNLVSLALYTGSSQFTISNIEFLADEEQHFDNSDWAAGYSGGGGTWTGSAWQSAWNPVYGVYGLALNDAGTWASGYRPDKVNISFTGASGTLYLDMYDGSDTTGTKMISNGVCASSPCELDTSWGAAGDIVSFTIAPSGTQFTLTDVVFSSSSTPPTPMNTSPYVEWNTTAGGSDSDWARSVKQTSDGGYIITGGTKSYGTGGLNRLWLAKFSSSGVIQWNTTVSDGDTCNGNSVIQTDDNGYMVLGDTAGSGAGNSDFWLLKFNSAGTLLWDKTFGGSDWDKGYEIIESSDGNYVITGKTSSYGAGNIDLWLIKVNASGDPIWNTTYGRADDDSGISLIETNDGGYAVGGETEDCGDAYSHLMLVKFNSSGGYEWNNSHCIGSYSGLIYSNTLVQTTDLGYVLGGYIDVPGNYYDIFYKKINSAGTNVWYNQIGTADDYYGYSKSVLKSDDNGVIILGSLNYYPDYSDYLNIIFKLDSNGHQVWNMTFIDNNISTNTGSALADTSDGGYIMAGASSSADVLLAKFKPQNFNQTIPYSSNFSVSDGSTNFSAEADIEDVKNATFCSGNGCIQFPELYSINASGEDYDTNVIVGDCFVFVNDLMLDDTFNASATISLANADGHCGDNMIYYVSGYYPTANDIRANGAVCTDCDQIQMTGNSITQFRAQHFSGYAIGSNVKLGAYDSFENSNTYIGFDITFYANYTAWPGGGNINGANCTIQFDSEPGYYQMSSYLGQHFTRGFNSVGTHTFNITCQAPGYNEISATDSVEIVEAPDKMYVLNRINNLGGSGSDHWYGVIDAGDYYLASGSTTSNLGSSYPGNSYPGSGGILGKINKTTHAILVNNNYPSDITFEDVIDSGDYFVAIGHVINASKFPGGTNDAGAYIAKINKSDLSIVDMNNIGGSQVFNSVIEDMNHYYAVGYNNNDCAVVKLNKADLSVASTNYFGGISSNVCRLTSVIKTPCELHAVGYTNADLTTYTGGNISSNYDFLIARFRDSDLSLNYLKNFDGYDGGSSIDGFSEIIYARGLYTAVGSSEGTWPGHSGTDSDSVIYTFWPVGFGIFAQSRSGGDSDDGFTSVFNEGWYTYAVGYSNSNLSNYSGGSEHTGGHTTSDFLISKFDPLLRLKNISNFGGTLDDYFYDVADEGDNFVAVGHTSSNLEALQPGGTYTVGVDFVFAKFGLNIASTIPTYHFFVDGPGTTNFSQEGNLDNVSNLTLCTGYGCIEFPENYSVNATGENYDIHIFFGDCFVSVDASSLDVTFNATAFLTWNNSDGHCGNNIIYTAESGTYTLADQIRVGDTRCAECTNIQMQNEFITGFTVPHFSSYAIGSNTRLDIYDSYEGSTAPVDGDIIFYTNYTNKTSGLHIPGAECNISFDSDPTQYTMTDNGINYNYTENFSSAGTHYFYVNCSKSGIGYNTLNATDDVDVGSAAVPEFSLLTLGLGLVIVLSGIFLIRRKT